MIKVFDPNMYTDECISKIRDVLNSGWIGMGPVVDELENNIREYIGCERFVALNSCTAALHLSLKVYNFKPGDKILTTPVTCPAPNLMILQEQLTPVFYDIDPVTGEPDINSIENLITLHGDEIKGLIVVHLGGYPCDMKNIQPLCDANNIKIIEDCAHAFGAEIDGVKIGNSDNLCCFSFHSLKNLTTGDGGGVSTNDTQLAERIKDLSWYGGTKHTYERFKQKKYTWDYGISEQGLKYHMNDITAAIGVVQLKYIDDDNKRRQEIANSYINRLSGVTVPVYESSRKSSYHFLPVHLSDDRDTLINRLNQADIYPSVHYKRNDLYDIFKKYSIVAPGVHSFCSTEITLPIHPKITDDNLNSIIDIVNSTCTT